MFRQLMILAISQVLSNVARSPQAYYDIDILSFYANSSKTFVEKNYYDLIRVSDETNRTLYGISASMTLKQGLSCDSLVRYAYTVKVNAVYQKNHILEGTYPLGELLNKWPNTPISNIIDSLQNCTTPPLGCPFEKGTVWTYNRCILTSTWTNILVSKFWKAEVTLYSPDNEMGIYFVAEFAFNDHNINKAKRPTLAQKERRNRKYGNFSLEKN